MKIKIIIPLLILLLASFSYAVDKIASHEVENDQYAWLGYVSQNYICTNFTANNTVLSTATIKLKQASAIPQYINISIWTSSASAPSKLVARSSGVLDSDVSAVSATAYNFTLNSTTLPTGNYLYSLY